MLFRWKILGKKTPILTSKARISQEKWDYNRFEERFGLRRQSLSLQLSNLCRKLQEDD